MTQFAAGIVSSKICSRKKFRSMPTKGGWQQRSSIGHRKKTYWNFVYSSMFEPVELTRLPPKTNEIRFYVVQFSHFLWITDNWNFVFLGLWKMPQNNFKRDRELVGSRPSSTLGSGRTLRSHLDPSPNASRDQMMSQVNH